MNRWEQKQKDQLDALRTLFPGLQRFNADDTPNDNMLWDALEALNELIDQRVEDRLDQEFERGDWRR